MDDSPRGPAENIVPQGQEPEPVANFIVPTGQKCPRSGHWTPVGHGGQGRTWIAKGRTMPPYAGKPAEWVGPSLAVCGAVQM
jgi:hypothetical protein